MSGILDATERISFAEAVEKLPRDARGRKVSPSTLVRHATAGRKGRLLRAWKVGLSWYTTSEALDAFYSPAPPTRQAPVVAPAKVSKAEARRQANLARRLAEIMA